MDKLEHIGARIRLFRKHQNLTLEELAYINLSNISGANDHFKGLDSSAARVRMPRLDEFPVLLSAIKEISAL